MGKYEETEARYECADPHVGPGRCGQRGLNASLRVVPGAGDPDAQLSSPRDEGPRAGPLKAIGQSLGRASDIPSSRADGVRRETRQAVPQPCATGSGSGRGGGGGRPVSHPGQTEGTAKNVKKGKPSLGGSPDSPVIKGAPLEVPGASAPQFSLPGF